MLGMHFIHLLASLAVIAHTQYYVVEIVRGKATEIPHFSQQVFFSAPLVVLVLYFVNVLVPPSE